MAAVINAPHAHHRPQRPVRPALRVLDGGLVPHARLAPRRLPASVYRRRRIAVAAVALAVLALVGLAFVGAQSVASRFDGTTVVSTGAPDAAPATAAAASGAAAVAPSAPAAAPATKVVQPGDTLWSIARELQPEGDVRPLVDRLASRLGGSSLTVGQRIPVDGLTS
jgi:hypothetical protein